MMTQGIRKLLVTDDDIMHEAERIVGRKHQQRSQAFAAFAAGHRLMGHRVHDIAACFGHRGILGHGGPRPHQGDDAWLDFRTVDVGYAHSF